MKVRRKPVAPDIFEAIQYRLGQPLPDGMHPADPRSEDQSPVLDQPNGAPSMEDGDWILVYPNGERWRCSRGAFEEFYLGVDELQSTTPTTAPDSDDSPVGDQGPLQPPHLAEPLHPPALKTKTVRELYDLLEARRIETNDFAGDAGTMEILLRVQSEDDCIVGGLTSLAIDPGCTEIHMLVLDGDAEATSRHPGVDL